tara:strand:- start:119 stop:253 length:135 start_codon:yes stop_codon:yes gene_type:complete
MLFIPRIWDIALPILMLWIQGITLEELLLTDGKGNVNVAPEVDV